jgi:hypothetical protein
VYSRRRYLDGVLIVNVLKNTINYFWPMVSVGFPITITDVRHFNTFNLSYVTGLRPQLGLLPMRITPVNFFFHEIMFALKLYFSCLIVLFVTLNLFQVLC